jgi:type I restriction enzyme S subunit
MIMERHEIPGDWADYQINDLAFVNPSQLSTKTDANYSFFYIDLSMVNKGRIDKPVFPIVFGESPSRARRVLKNNDIIMSMVRPNLCGHGQINDDLKDCVCSTGFAVLRPKISKDQSYIYQYLFTGHIQEQINSLLAGSNYPAITPSDIDQLSILAPKSSLERYQIAGILELWDLAINLTEHLIDAKQERRRWLRHQLLKGKLRLSGFKDVWRKVTIGEVAEESTIRNQGRLGTDSVRAVNKIEGMIPMKSRIIAADLKRYKVIKKTWFAYNPMRINIGSICQWMGNEEALVSPDYVVFLCKEDCIDHRFFNAFRQSHRWQSFMEGTGNGSVRVRIYFDNLSRLKLLVPPLDEQRRIADIIEKADREIDLLVALLEAYREQKKGLMQQLLTGKRRVKF